MKVLAIGDPHGDLKKIKKISMKGIDLVLLTGDLGSSNLKRKIAFGNSKRKQAGLAPIEYSSNFKKRAFMESYISSLKLVRYLAKYAPVYAIFGNVENSNKEIREYSKEIGERLPFLKDNLLKIKGVRILNNKLANFNGIRIGGLEYFIDVSWVKEFKPSDYKIRLENAEKETARARRVLRGFGKIDILMCHQPPYKILDKVSFKEAPKYWLGKHAGSKAVLDYIKTRKPNYVVCGHIHEGQGEKNVGKTKVCNLGMCGHKVMEF